jgi:BON domain
MIVPMTDSGWLNAAEPDDHGVLTLRYGRLYRRHRVSRALPLLVGLAGMLVAVAGQYLLVLPHMQDDLTSRIAQRLQAAGLSGLKVTVRGRDVTLDGAVPALSDVQRATGIVEGVDGVRVVQEVFVSYPQPGAGAKPSPSR